MHQTNPNYGASATHSAEIRNILIKKEYKTVIDFGCGKGELADNLNSTVRGNIPYFICHKYDPAIEEFSEYPEPADLVIANDVFEHFDPHEMLEELSKVNKLARKGIYANISCRPAVHLLPNGLNAHTCLYSWQEWIELCNLRFSNKELQLVRWNKNNNNVVLFYENKT